MVPEILRQLRLPHSHSFFLFGPRQTGKTALVRSIFPANSVLQYDLLKTEEYMRLVARPATLREEVQARRAEQSTVFIDEVQRVPSLLDEVHGLMESPNPPCFVLTGSSARKLKRAGVNMLGGRAWTLRLHPFTHVELSSKFDLSRALSRGTLPPVYLDESDESANMTLRSYVETYLKEEIEAEALVRSTGTFLRFLSQAGQESGNMLNFSTISREAATSAKTVREYFQILEDTLIGRFLPAWSRGTRDRLATHPRFYLFDTGVRRALTRQLNVELLPSTPEYGRCFEHFIVNECFRLNDYHHKDYEFSYYRTEGGAEVDLIVEFPDGRCTAAEIKSSPEPAARDFRSGLVSFRSHRPDARLVCVCDAPRRRAVEGIDVLPWREFFSEMFQSSAAPTTTLSL